MIVSITYKMLREILRVSFLLVVLQFHSTPFYFLSATGNSHEPKSVFGSTIIHESSNNESDTSRAAVESYLQILEGLKDQSQFVNELSSSESEVSSGSGEAAVQSRNDIIMMERKLLQLLGMSERPQPVRDKDKAYSLRNKNIPKYVVDLYKSQSDLSLPTSHLNLPGRFTGNANTVRSFYSAGTEIDLPGLDYHLRYDISSIPTFEEITGAELHVSFNITSNQPSPPKTSFHVLVHDVVKLSNRKNRELAPITYPVDSKLVSPVHYRNSSEFTLIFDVFPAISRLVHTRKPSKSVPTMGLAIQLVPRNRNAPKSLDNVFSNILSSDKKPILHTFSDDGKNPKKHWTGPSLSRHYRSVRNKRRSRGQHRHKNRRRSLCSRKRMFVDFTDVGWNDWIVAPPGYQAFFCSGECPFPMAEHLNATNHAVIQALVNSMNPRLVPAPCCVPNKYSSLSLLYTDSSDRIVLKNYNEMIVDSCGCS